ncbi:MAG: ABC1 kinase family protein [Moorellales bacterium]
MPGPLRRRHWQRLRQIVNVAVAQGFGYIVEQLGLAGLVSRSRRGGTVEGERPRLSRGERLARALEELGPTFIKLGQMLSTRSDLLPADVVAELEKLQDRVPPFSAEEVREAVRRELGVPLEQAFAEFDPVPIAAASIGQVHRARLFTGEEVAVKVQRPRLEETVEADLEILFALARLADLHPVWGRMYDFTALAEEFAFTLRQEMDFQAEGRNADRLRQNLTGMPQVRIPRVYWEYTTRRLLTMEYVAGTKLNEPERLAAQKVDRRAVARLLIQAVLKQIFLDGFFHADLHPGNLAVQPGPVLVFMDFGLVGTLAPERREQCLAIVRGLVKGDAELLVRALTALGVATPHTDREGLRRDLERIREKYYRLPFSQMQLGRVLGDLVESAFKHRLRLPRELALMIKTLTTLEAVVRELDPELDLAEVATAFRRQYLREQMRPPALRARLRRAWEEAAWLAVGLPRNLNRLLDKLAHDGISLELRHRELPEFRAHLDQIANRLCFAIILLSFSLMMTGLVISSALVQGSRGLFFWRLPVLEIGFGAAAVLFLGLIWAIVRSGRF